MFEDATGLTFMESETFEQFAMPADILGDSRPFLTDGMTVYISFIDGKPVSVELPQQVVCTVVETEPVVKGRLLLRPISRAFWITVSALWFRPLSMPATRLSFHPLKELM